MRCLVVKEIENTLLVRKVDSCGMPLEYYIIHKYKNEYYLIGKSVTPKNAENIMTNFIKTL